MTTRTMPQSIDTDPNLWLEEVQGEAALQCTLGNLRRRERKEIPE